MIVGLFLLAAAPPAAAQGLGLAGDLDERGRVALEVTGTPFAVVEVAEVSGQGRRLPDVVLDAAGRGRLDRAAAWSCKTRTRQFYALSRTERLEASTTVTTPRCDRRYELQVRPRRPRAGRPVRIRAVDSFSLASAPKRICARGPGRACGRMRDGTATIRLPRAGRWKITGRHVRTARLEVRRKPGRVSILATGDSMIQIIDGFLKSRLPQARVRSDARISTGISKPGLLNWPRHARRQGRHDVTIVFLGANDGFPMGGAACCGRAWRKTYANRVAQMMRTYKRGGSVYWSLLPAPRAGNFRRVFVAVNAAVRRAARRERAALIDLPRTFTPDYRFRQTIGWGGRTVSVRQGDGVHLNVAGASIAATLMIRRMRRDGVL